MLWSADRKGPELPRQPLFGGEALEGDVLEWKVEAGFPNKSPSFASCRASSAGLNLSSRLIILWQPDAKRDHHKQNLAVSSNVSGVFAQSRNKSRIYVHVKAYITEPNSFRCGRKMLHMLRAPREDLADGLQSLTAGQRVAFQAVSDAPDCPFDVAKGYPTCLLCRRTLTTVVSVQRQIQSSLTFVSRSQMPDQAVHLPEAEPAA